MCWMDFKKIMILSSRFGQQCRCRFVGHLSSVNLDHRVKHGHRHMLRIAAWRHPGVLDPTWRVLIGTSQWLLGAAAQHQLDLPS